MNARAVGQFLARARFDLFEQFFCLRKFLLVEMLDGLLVQSSIVVRIEGQPSGEPLPHALRFYYLPYFSISYDFWKGRLPQPRAFCRLSSPRHLAESNRGLIHRQRKCERTGESADRASSRIGGADYLCAAGTPLLAALRASLRPVAAQAPILSLRSLEVYPRWPRSSANCHICVIVQNSLECRHSGQTDAVLYLPVALLRRIVRHALAFEHQRRVGIHVV